MTPAKRTWTVAAAYVVLAIVMTWPLALVLPREIAGDLGDPLFNSWVIHWTAGQVLHTLHGGAGHLAAYWNANIFYPAPLTLARSENLAPQMVQALPVLAATNNIVLAYNLLLMASITLSGLGAYLLVQDITGLPEAAFVAGVAFAFAPFRLDQWSHLDVLSSQWMPFAMLGVRRFVVTGKLRALAGGTAAVVVQALSCLYYLAFFTPFLAAYAVYEMAAHGRLRVARMWTALLGSAAVTALVVGLFLWPYVVVRQGSDASVRTIAEVRGLSADTHAFATISSKSRLLGSFVRAMPRNENQGFPGFTILALALGGLAVLVVRVWRQQKEPARPVWWRRAATWIFALLLLGTVVMLLHLLATGLSTTALLGSLVRLRYRPARITIQITALAAGLLLASTRLQKTIREVHSAPAGFFAWAALGAALLSLGPTVYVAGRELGPGPYGLLFQVPGFAAFRAVSLYFMLVALFLALAAGLGAAAVPGRRARRVVAAIAVLLILAESWSAPVETHVPPQVAVTGFRAAPSPLYRWVRDLPDGVVIAELPFGGTFDEAGYTFASGYHRKPIVNGYSGFYPRTYERLMNALKTPTAEAWQALARSGATHVIVHEELYADDAQGPRVSGWLRGNGARELAGFDRARVFVLP